MSDAVRHAIEAKNLTRRFGRHVALCDLTLAVGEGRCTVLFGPNGAGKTTLIKVLSTLAVPTEGTALVCGADVRTQAVEVRRLVGVLSHESFLYESMTAAENLRFCARMHGVRISREEIDALLDSVGMLAKPGGPASAAGSVGTMSRGMTQRVALARCLLHDPKVILLDEPYSGLDPDGAEILTRQIHKLRESGRTMLITTHQLSVGLEVADDVAILSRGRLCYRADRNEVRTGDFRQEYARAVAGATV